MIQLESIKLIMIFTFFTLKFYILHYFFTGIKEITKTVVKTLTKEKNGNMVENKEILRNK